MPSSTSGYTGAEILAHVQQYTGNTSANFVSFLSTVIPLAEQRFCKVHDWSFLNKTDLALTVTSGTNKYALTTSSIGYYMAAKDVRNVWSVAGNTYLKKTDVDTIRRMDPNENDGTTAAFATHWAPVDDNTIMIYPPLFEDTALQLDGKITPTALFNLSNYPTIPMRLQDGFIEYVKGLALDRENDQRANGQKSFSLQLIKQDIQNDLTGLGDSDLPRMRAYWEQAMDGINTNLQDLYNHWAFYGTE